MSWATIRIFLWHELRMVYRDHRTILLSVLLPVVLLPLLLVALQAVQNRRMGGGQAGSYLFGIAPESRPQLQQLFEDLDKRFRESLDDRVETSLRNGDIDLYISLVENPEEPGEPAEDRLLPEHLARHQQGVPVIRITFRADDDRSMQAYRLFSEELRRLKREILDRRLRHEGVPHAIEDYFQVETVEMATPDKVTGAMIGPYVAAFLTLLLLGGGSVAAMDILAGEKERGSMQTLLTSAASREEIVVAKQLAVFVVAAAIALIQILNVLFYVTFRLIDLPAGFALSLPPSKVAALALVALPLAAFLAGVLLYISGRAASYKEAQVLYFPVFIVCLVVSLAGVLPDISLRSAIVVVPIANSGVALRSIFVGEIDLMMLVVQGLVNLLAAVVLAYSTARALTRELLLSGRTIDQLEGTERSFSERLLSWYALLAAGLLVIPGNFEVLSQLRGQVLFNQLVLFGLGPLLIARFYRLDLKKAFALRPVQRPAVWLAVLLLIPSGQLAATGIIKIVQRFLPVSQELMDEMIKMLNPANISTLELLVLIAILPGIFEELAFRGLLVYGLRKRLRPIALVLTVGFIFGAFHFQLNRILPTGYLGAVLTAVCLLTGSVLPGIVAHIGNNAMGVWALKESVDFSGFPAWVYLLALAMQALALGILYRERTPYPGLLKVFAPQAGRT